MPFVETFSFLECEQFIYDLNIAEKGSLAAKALAIVLWGLHHTTWNTTRIRKYSGYDLADIHTVMANFRKNGFCNQLGTIEIQFEATDDFGIMIELTLIAMAGAGEIKRTNININNP